MRWKSGSWSFLLLHGCSRLGKRDIGFGYFCLIHERLKNSESLSCCFTDVFSLPYAKSAVQNIWLSLPTQSYYASYPKLLWLSSFTLSFFFERYYFSICLKIDRDTFYFELTSDTQAYHRNLSGHYAFGKRIVCIVVIVPKSLGITFFSLFFKIDSQDSLSRISHKCFPQKSSMLMWFVNGSTRRSYGVITG